ncbi:phage portal protein [Virgibacillus pantothenticus]
MGLFDRVFNRNKELGYSFDIEFLELFEKKSERLHMKRLAFETCISFLARTVSQTEFRVRNGDAYVKDELYYRLNTRPNKNMTASTFWQKFISKLIYDNEVLIIQADDGDLLIADDFQQKEYAVYEDVFSNIIIRGFEFKRSYKQSEVIHLKYGNEKLSRLLDSLFYDYGDLFGYILKGQKRKNQLRATVDMDMLAAKSGEKQAKLQEFIDNMYEAVEKKDVAIIPQQPGFEYKEQSGNGVAGQSVDEINKVTDGFLDQVAIAIGIPPSLIRGDMADVEKQTKNYMFFSVSPLLKKIKDEADVKFFTKKESIEGKSIEIRKPSYRDIFDLATAVDKLVSSGVFNGNEIRSELGYETTDEKIHNEYFITKNYTTADEAVEGGDED